MPKVRKINWRETSPKRTWKEISSLERRTRTLSWMERQISTPWKRTLTL